MSDHTLVQQQQQWRQLRYIAYREEEKDERTRKNGSACASFDRLSWMRHGDGYVRCTAIVPQHRHPVNSNDGGRGSRRTSRWRVTKLSRSET